MQFASCEKGSVYNPDSISSTKDLTAPADFDWKTSESTILSITSPVSTFASIYTDAACSADSLIMENIALNANEAKEISLELPTYITSVYVQYPTANGTGTSEVNVGSMTRAANKSLVLPATTASNTDSDNKFTHVYYPNKNSKGTLMFEDLYPSKGDYDFNDFVIGYNVDAFFSVGSNGETRDGFTMTFQVRAIGGSLPFRPALRLKGWAMSNLEGATIEFKSTLNDINMELVSGRSGNDDVIFVINGTENLKSGGFYNTYANKTSTNFPVITCKVIRNNKNDERRFLNYMSLAAALPNYFDFFIQNTSTTDEIHFYGFGPTDMCTTQSSTTEYRDPKSKLVWAIAIPQLIAHPQEGTDILKVYPNFKGWVSSGGNSSVDWYTKKPHDTVIDLGDID
ncbi:hypothetical protein Bache_3096 [Bacteroides helcogenes P 36-108]|uniref:DUF4842 domain-containing protein n=2 Tax=Bacteroides helcogenes TaxID=290053 RepID=E6SQH6_BACT6|nr:hypothetical protein Bache_3096 [Bacteroides helcogenes P 36-108]